MTLVVPRRIFIKGLVGLIAAPEAALPPLHRTMARELYRTLSGGGGGRELVYTPEEEGS